MHRHVGSLGEMRPECPLIASEPRGNDRVDWLLLVLIVLGFAIWLGWRCVEKRWEDSEQ